ncbi:hypothetical protein TrST_g10045 [Triparma strigata]|uniref:Angio-associated migratory cell protein n=1 Tax=Triparma strigata TaxID=1606541 RepID=A0A9W7B2X0_9STRA|nr:hypothetical protein TrST_g10045 [Triparma strigata]
MESEPTNNDPPLPEPSDDDDLVDTAPVFLQENEAEEVQVDDSAPIEDEEMDTNMDTNMDMEFEGVAPGSSDQMLEGAEEEEGEVALPTLTLDGHRGPVYAMSLVSPSPGAYYLATGSGDDTAGLSSIDTATGATKFETLPGHSESVAAVAFSKDQTLVASCDYAGTISLWMKASDGLPPPPASPSTPDSPAAPTTYKLDRTLPPGPTDVEWVAWHPLGNVFSVGSTDGTVWMYLAKTGAVMQVFAGHDPDNGDGGGVTCGAFSNCGKNLLTGGGEGSFRIWNPKNGLARHVFKDGQDNCQFTKGQVTCFHQNLGASKDIVAVGGNDGFVALVHIPSKKTVGSGLHHSPEAGETSSVECLRFSPVNVVNGNLLASGGVDGNLKVFEIGVGGGNQSGLLRSTASHKSGGVTCLRWKETTGLDRAVYTGCADGKIRLWDVRPSTALVLKVFKGHEDMVLCLDVLDNVLVSGSDDHKIHVWAV